MIKLFHDNSFNMEGGLMSILIYLKSALKNKITICKNAQIIIH